jgi:pilus assembly protein CpaF
MTTHLLDDAPKPPASSHFKVGDAAIDLSRSPAGQRMIAEREAAARLEAVQQQLRRMVNDRLRPPISGISVYELNEAADPTREKVSAIVHDCIADLQKRGLAGQGPVITQANADALYGFMIDLLFGAGPLETLFQQHDVEDIILNTVRGADGRPVVEVWSYRQSGKQREQIAISPDDVIEIVNRNAAHQGRKLDPTTPILNAQMRNGSRMNAVLDPVTDPHLSVTIRIHRLVARTFDDLIQLGTLTPAAAAWLEMCIKARLAIVIGGGTSSGKTNLLNAIARVADPRERIVAIEDTRELDLVVPDRVYLVTVNSRDPDRIVTQRHLVANALRMRPDRIVMGEVRDAAAWDAIKAATTGHEGTLLTLHAEDASGVIQRLIRLSREAPETANMPDTAMREAVAAAFQLIVFLQRMRLPNGSFARFVTEIVELNGLVGDGVVQQRKLFAWQAGRLEWTRQWPHERTKRRLFEAGFSDRDIESAFMRT